LGQAVACGDDGIASLDRIRYRRHDGGVFLYAFDLIELDGAELRRDPLAVRRPRSRASSRLPRWACASTSTSTRPDGPLAAILHCGRLSVVWTWATPR
jgi:hypothetical protein